MGFVKDPQKLLICACEHVRAVRSHDCRKRSRGRVSFFDQYGDEYPATGSFSVLRKVQRDNARVGKGSGYTDATVKPLVLHAFKGGYDEENSYGDLILDGAGNLYGTAYQGGRPGYGVVFQLQPNSKGGWTEKVLHAFVNTPAGNPVAGLVMDPAGNIYGNTMLGATQSSCGGGCGSLFKLSPVSTGGWTYKVVHNFGQGTDGYHPTGDLILDSAGNIYGTTQAGGAQGSGLVFEIMH
jgi:uncharacterized repeat protein (TIGR03803 family)